MVDGKAGKFARTFNLLDKTIVEIPVNKPQSRMNFKIITPKGVRVNKANTFKRTLSK